jgi:ribonuclease J
MSDLSNNRCLKKSIYIYSQWEGYWDQGAYDMVKYWLEQHSIPKLSIHTSGHASPNDLMSFVKALNPHKVVPIHSFFPEKYPELFPNVEAHNDGENWEV